MKIGVGTKRNLGLIFALVLVLCCILLASVYLVDSVNTAMDARDEYNQAQLELTAARQNKQELQVLIDMYREDPNAFMEYVARKSGYIKDGEVIFDLNGK
ncbi:MAG: septum formation initiator family protein [Clostridia bacterium]|nr:septum formation initiator family protein [Clostridia bacterium]